MKKFVILENKGKCYRKDFNRVYIEGTVLDMSVVFETNDYSEAWAKYETMRDTVYDYDNETWYMYDLCKRAEAKKELAYNAMMKARREAC